MKRCRLPILILLAMIYPAGTYARGDVTADLPPRIQTLLIQEMNAIEEATQTLLGALVRGQHDTVAAKAQAIHDSVILQQKLTETDRQTLKRALPAPFLQQDKAFHTLSAQLADAARPGDLSRQHALFADLVRACTQCHSAYANSRFPEFEAPIPN